MFRLKRTTESASVQLNQLQPDKSSDQSRTMAWHWIGSVPIIYIFITCAGYASLLYISYANCHLESGYNLWPIITYIDVTVPIFTYHSLHIILLPFIISITKRVFNFPKISHLGAKQPELQFFAFLCICQAICFGLMVHYSYQVWKLEMRNSKVSLCFN